MFVVTAALGAHIPPSGENSHQIKIMANWSFLLLLLNEINLVLCESSP